MFNLPPKFVILKAADYYLFISDFILVFVLSCYILDFLHLVFSDESSLIWDCLLSYPKLGKQGSCPMNEDTGLGNRETSEVVSHFNNCLLSESVERLPWTSVVIRLDLYRTPDLTVLKAAALCLANNMLKEVQWKWSSMLLNVSPAGIKNSNLDSQFRKNINLNFCLPYYWQTILKGLYEVILDFAKIIRVSYIF